jgi:H+/Cl- antiporter ClcA
MEMVSVGVMYYIALVPCVISSLVAHGIAYSFGVSNEMFIIRSIPKFGIITSIEISVLAILCALVSILFCVLLHKSEDLYKRFFTNPYIRVIAGGCIIIVLTLLVGNQDYNGTGINIIEHCINGTVRPEAFLLKMIFTALTLGAGYKGGEIVLYRSGFWMPVRKPTRLLANTVYRCRYDRSLLWRNELSDHIPSDQLRTVRI